MQRLLLALLLLAFALPPLPTPAGEEVTLLNVSYDPTREFFSDYNALFASHWKDKTGKEITIKQSHGGSAKQARSAMEGLPADVVTLALAYDIDAIAARTGKLPADWQSKLPNNSSPYTSVVVFLVHSGNPKHIKDWDDLTKEGLQVITANPKTSGGARWNYLAAWAYASQKYKGDETATKAFMKTLFKNVPILDSGARGATTSFTERGMGDVLITWENEAMMVQKEVGKGKFEIVRPSLSILAEPPVAVVQSNAEKKGTLQEAQAYLEYLYSPPAQELIAKHYFRPTDKDVAAKYASHFPSLPLVTIKDLGGWEAMQKKHFAEGGTFDEIYASK